MGRVSKWVMKRGVAFLILLFAWLQAGAWEEEVLKGCSGEIHFLEDRIQETKGLSPRDRLVSLEKIYQSPDWECPAGTSLVGRLEDEMSGEMARLVQLKVDGVSYPPTIIFYCDQLDGNVCQGTFADDTSHMGELSGIPSGVIGPESIVEVWVDPTYPLEFRRMLKGVRSPDYKIKWRPLREQEKGMVFVSSSSVVVAIVKGKGEKLFKKSVWKISPPSK